MVRAPLLLPAVAFVALIFVWGRHPTQILYEVAGATVTGVVASGVVRHPWGDECELALDTGPHVELVVRASLEPGDRIRVRGRLEPFDEPRNPGEASARELAAERGLAGRLVDAELLARAPAASWDVASLLPRLRAWAGSIVRKRVPEPQASILAGALWGERGSLPHDLKLEFQETGTVHILVTAGLHLGVVAMLSASLCGLLGIPRVAASLATIATIWCYAAVSGAHLPSLRAATMITVAFAARACGARAFSWNCFAVAAIVVAALWPAAIGGASFALSFSCVAAILLFAEHIAEWCERHAVPGFAAEACALTVATQIGVWPLTAQTFLTVAPYAVVANLAVVPVVGSTMILGLAQIATDRLPLVPDALAAIDTGLLTWIAGAVGTIASLPGAHLAIASPPAWSIACYDVAAIGAAAALARRRTTLALGAFALGTILVVAPAYAAPTPFSIVALDVGQGDGIVIRTPRGHTLMIDTGGRLEIGSDEESSAEAVGERRVVPYLIRSGVRHVDGIILTHPHGEP